MALHSGGKGQTASIDSAMSRRRTCKAVQDTASLWKEREVISTQVFGGT